MFDVEVVLSKAFDIPSHLHHWLFEGFQPLQSAVVGSNIKLPVENVAAEVEQRVDKREHLFASHRVILLRLKQRAAKVWHRLFDSVSYHLR